MTGVADLDFHLKPNVITNLILTLSFLLTELRNTGVFEGELNQLIQDFLSLETTYQHVGQARLTNNSSLQSQSCVMKLLAS